MRIPFLSIITFSLLFHNAIAAEQHEKKLPSAMVVGTVYCDTCFRQQFSKSSRFISGASVAVECGETGQKPSFHQEAKTNKHGEFIVHLPFAVGKHVRRIEKCSVRLISSSEPYCAMASIASSSSLHLKSRKQGTHVFSAGYLTFKPLKQPDVCFEKPNSETASINSEKNFFPYPNFPSFPPLNRNPPSLNLPPIPQIPTVPNFPSIPNLVPGQPTTPELANPTITSEEKPDQPNFFYYSPLVPSLPAPVPLQPSPPSTNLPPRFPFIAPPPPIFSFTFPPFPLPPRPPTFPTTPAAADSIRNLP